ncbi:MAG: hypothetical protein H6R26_2120 [Proteobacteria bacterium]|nr:hypothetical protein [Pseudomonadota bacterium]
MYALYGIERGDFAGGYEAWLNGVHPDDRTLCDEVTKLALLGEREYDTEFRVVWPDDSIHHLKAYGLVVRDTDGKPLRMTGINFDITEHKQAEDRIRNLAFYDTLTKLPNRRLLLNRFELALMASARSKHFGAVLFLDMDKFKALNDLLGHCNGDLMLIQVAERIRRSIREVDTAARFGGDEFVVLFADLGNSREVASQRAAWIAEKIRAALAEPYHIKEHVHHSSPSIGVCLYRGHEVSVQDLIKHADIAMYQAKNAARNTVRFYDPISQQAVKMRAAVESDLRRALSDHQLRLYYQIQFDGNGLPRGAEALVRWMHPERGMILPKQFIPISEESSLILEIGRWVLESACRQLAEWTKNEASRSLAPAVNVSARQFMMHDFVETIDQMVRAHGIDPSLLRLELAESAMLKNIPDIITRMKALKAIGVKLSLDDFGTGYSSIANLKRLPIDQIKIGQSVMRDVASDANDAMMVKAIIDIAKNFSMNVIAEGVETEEQFSFLKNSGCTTFQGYLFAKPMPIEQVDIKLLH